MASILNYVFGNNGTAGIAIISGDAAGFSYIDEPLEESEILSTIESYINLEEDKFDDEEKAEMLKDAELKIEKIHSYHVNLFTGHRANR
jgi:hypothetical protein